MKTFFAYCIINLYNKIIEQCLQEFNEIKQEKGLKIK